MTAIFSALLLFFAPFIAQADAIEISKTIWRVKKLTGDNLSESRVRKIAFANSHEFKLALGCDYYRGRYQTEGNKLRISTLIKVAGDCVDEKQNDASFLHALLNVEAYEINEDNLKLTNGRGEHVATLEHAEPFDLPAKKAGKNQLNTKRRVKSRVSQNPKKRQISHIRKLRKS
jgi:heat shock protein HslJ